MPRGLPLSRRSIVICLPMKRFMLKLLYYYFASHLPRSCLPHVGRLSKAIRYAICRRLFSECGSNVNIEALAGIGDGREIRIGDNSGLGFNSFIGKPVTIGKDVMMGPHVTYPPSFTLLRTHRRQHWIAGLHEASGATDLRRRLVWKQRYGIAWLQADRQGGHNRRGCCRHAGCSRLCHRWRLTRSGA
jgi:hypothetical protein